MRKSRSAIRRGIQFDHQEHVECREAGARSLVDDERANVLRRPEGDSGTHYEWIMWQRNTADVAKMLTRGGGR